MLLLPVSSNTYSFAEQTVQVTIALGAGSSADSACVATNTCFTPNPVQITPGDTVAWTNTDTVSHTVTSGKPIDPIVGSIFDSSIIRSGQTFSFTFQNPGTYNYFCLVHPWMTGVVVTSAPPPTIIIPPLLKIIAGEWASGQISDSDFLQSVQYFINQKLLIMPIPQANSGATTAPIPMWIKTNAFWWANGTIGDSDFIKGIQYLFENGYLPVPVNGIPNSVSQALSQSITQLINDVNKMSLPQGTANSLAAKLNSAQSSLSSHQNNVAKVHLNSFISEVDAQSRKKITADQANELVSAAQNIVNSIT